MPFEKVDVWAVTVTARTTINANATRMRFIEIT
jgi:hypothetical protein